MSSTKKIYTFFWTEIVIATLWFVIVWFAKLPSLAVFSIMLIPWGWIIWQATKIDDLERGLKAMTELEGRRNLHHK